MSSAGVHEDIILNRDQNRLYLLLLFKSKPFIQQPQTLLDRGGSMKPVTRVFLTHLVILIQNTKELSRVFQKQYFDLK